MVNKRDNTYKEIEKVYGHKIHKKNYTSRDNQPFFNYKHLLNVIGFQFLVSMQ